MTTKKKSAIQQITVPTRTLHRLVKPVIPCADSTGMLPVLNTVRIELRDGYLLASATDRFRLAFCRQPLAFDEDGKVAPTPKGVEFKALIDLPDLHHILKLFPVGRHGDGAVTFTIDGDRLQVEAVGGLGLTFADLRVSYVLNPGDFPDLDTIAHKTLTATGDPLPEFAVNPEFIATFKAAVQDRHEGLEILAPKEAGKPLVCRVGDHFLGLLMPKHRVSPSDAASTDPSWAGFLRPAEKSEVAA